MEKQGFFFIFAMAIFLFGKAGVSLAATEVSGDINVATNWKKEGSPYIVQKYIYVKAPLTIEPGVVVKFKNLSVAGLGIKSSFTAVGDALDKVVFTSTCDYENGGNTKAYCSYKAPLSGDWSGLYVYPESQSPAAIEFAKILYASAGISYAATDSAGSFKKLSVKQSEIRYCSSAGIFLRYTQLILDGLILANNYSGLEVYNANYGTMPKIRNSAIFGNGNGVKGTGAGRTCVSTDARYNWWGDPSGPYYSYSGAREATNLNGIGNRVIGSCVLFRPWNQSDPTIPKEPVIFIPGIGASLNPDLMISGTLSDNWTMFDHTYDGMLAAFEAMGYVEGKNFFVAYYDWRQSNAESAEKYLKPAIEKALSKSDASKVNIVTHSMGGLVARSYVQSDAYANDVDNLIMIAPPNRGSSDAYTAWEGGYIPKNWEDGWIIRAYLNYMNIAKKTFSTYETIHNFIPSLRELMPAYDYLHPVGDGENLKSYLSMHEQNNFLEKLNSNIGKLNERTRLSIILGNNQPTVNAIPVVASDKESLWVDGKPDPIDPEKNDRNGDGTVLMPSGDTDSDFRDVLDYDHREIVSKSEKIVAERLNERLDDIYDSPKIDNEVAFWTDAPADLEITDPDGYKLSKDKEEINNSRYAQEKNKDGFKIASVPNPKKGKYEIKLSGHGSGEYNIGVEYVSHDGKTADESKTAEVEIISGETREYEVVNDPENSSNPITDIIPKDIIEPTIVLTSPVDGKNYLDNEKIPIKYTVSDNMSAVKDMRIEIYLDDNEVSGDSIDMSKIELGEHEFWLYAQDESDNEAEAGISFTVSKTPPIDPSPSNENDGNQSSTGSGGTAAADSGNASGNFGVTPVLSENNNSSSSLTSSGKKSKHKKKSKRKKNDKDTANGVKKYQGKIKIIESSGADFFQSTQSARDVFGYSSTEEMLKKLDRESISKESKHISADVSNRWTSKVEIATENFSRGNDHDLTYEKLIDFTPGSTGKVLGASVSNVPNRNERSQGMAIYVFWGIAADLAAIFTYKLIKLKRLGK